MVVVICVVAIEWLTAAFSGDGGVAWVVVVQLLLERWVVVIDD